MTRAVVALRSFFTWLERSGGATVPRSTLESALGDGTGTKEVWSALAKAGVVREGPRATTLPCPELGADCVREVCELSSSDLDVASSEREPRYVAACGASPRACETIDVSVEALLQSSVSIANLAAVVRVLLGVEDAGRSPSKSARAEPVPIGEQLREGAQARDVVLFVRPREEALAAWLALRELAPRPTLALVPTASAASADLAARHGPGAHVELDVLSDLFDVRGAELVLAKRLRVVRSPLRAPDVAPSAAVVQETKSASPAVRIPLPKNWREVKIRLVDGETIQVDVAGHHQRMTYVDLGLAGARNRKPVKAWALLCACCEGRGTFRWKDFGEFENARQVVTRLRRAMCKAFGVEEDPFEKFSYRDQWRTKFRASVE